MSLPPHILTLTCNLLAERTLEFATWSPGRTQRAAGESFQVGGKGINVSKMLTRLQTPNTALCFTGGAPGAECETWLRAQGFAYRAFATDTPTRAGTVVRDRSGTHRETTFLGPDAPPDAAAIRACGDFLDAQPDGQVLALCGSVPGWNGARFDPLRAALTRWSDRGMLIADTYGPPLGWIAAQPAAALIKINLDELRTIAPGENVEHMLNVATGRWPRTRWVVTDGPRAVWLVEPGERAMSMTPPPIAEVSPTGSGDVLFACIAYALFEQKRSLREAVAFAIPYAAANAAHPGVAEFSIPQEKLPPRDARSRK